MKGQNIADFGRQLHVNFIYLIYQENLLRRLDRHSKTERFQLWKMRAPPVVFYVYNNNNLFM